MPRYYIKNDVVIKGIGDLHIGIESEPTDYDLYKDSELKLTEQVKYEGGEIVLDETVVVPELELPPA